MAYKNIYEEEYNLCGSVFKLNCQKKLSRDVVGNLLLVLLLQWRKKANQKRFCHQMKRHLVNKIRKSIQKRTR